MRFIQLLNFQTAPEEIQRKLRLQLTPNAGTATRWVEWTPKIQSLVGQPDVTLVYAVNLGWRTLKMLTDQTQESPIVLYGCLKPLLGMPTLSNIGCIDDLRQYFCDDSDPIHITTEHLPVTPVKYMDWKHTVPVQLRPHA